MHDREVSTNYAGELIQHDSSYHLWSPSAKEKWYLITSLDDYSRFMLYGVLVKKETSWSHIMALQSVFLSYGLPYSYYVDSPTQFFVSFGEGILSGENIAFLLMEQIPSGNRF
jgi:hypothetical protein